MHIFFHGDKAFRKMPNTTMEVVTAVPMTALLLASALGPLVMGRCSLRQMWVQHRWVGAARAPRYGSVPQE